MLTLRSSALRRFARLLRRPSRKKSVDNVRLQFHVLTPKTRGVQNNEIRLRYDVTLAAKTTRLTPTPMTDDVVAKPEQKAAQIGGAFIGAFNKLPRINAKIIWDCELQMNPPVFKPTKLKLWLTAKVELLPGTYYLLQ